MEVDHVTTLANPFAPSRLITWAAIFAAICAGLMIPLTGDLKLQTQAIVAAGAVAVGALLVIPNRRIALVCAWVLAHPLSLEKVFPVLSSAHGFLPPSLVISGSDLVLYALIVTMLLEATVLEKKTFHWGAALLPYCLLVGWVFVTFFLCGPTGVGVMQVAHWVKMLIFLVTLSSAIRTRDEVLTVLVAAAIAVLLQSAILGAGYALKRKFGFSSKVTAEAMMVFSDGGNESITRATGTVGHVNQQAMFHTFFTIPLLALFMVRNWIWRLLAAIVLTASFCAIILTFSRASWISCSLATGVIFFLAWRYGRITRSGWLGISAGAAVVLIAIGAFSGMIVTRLTKGDDGASSSRIRMAMLALEHASLHPITGVGPGNFISAKVDRDPIEWARNVWLPRGVVYKPRYVAGLELYEVELQGKWYYMPGVVHNKFLLMTAEFGLVGIALFLWYQFRILKHALSGLRAHDPVLWWVAVGLVATFWANQSEFSLELFYDDKTVLMPLFVNALTIAVSRIALESTRTEVAV